MKNINKILSIFLLSGLLFSSCNEDFLTTEPKGTLSESSVTTAEGIYEVLNDAYSGVEGDFDTGSLGLRSGTVRGGESMKGRVIERDWPDWDRNNIALDNEGNSDNLTNNYGSIYVCNQVISLANESTDLTDDEKTQLIANARFLRGHYYFLLWKNFRYAPWVDETSESDFVKNYTGEYSDDDNYIDIAENIIADFEYAAEYLEESPSNYYFANNWAAKTYLAKVLVYQGNYIELDGGDGETQFKAAKELYDEIIPNGQNSLGVAYALNDSYKSNFDPDNKNSSESIFAVQSVANSQYTDLMVNSWQLVFYPNYFRTAAGRSGGFSDDVGAPSQWYVDHFIVDEDGIPTFDVGVGAAQTIPNGSEDETISDDAFVVDQTIPVDPRLDIIVARRGVDHNGYGKQDLDAWGTIENATDFGYYREKKYILSPEKYYSATISGSDALDLNMDILTYRDVLLLAAEVEARLGNLNDAMAYVDDIRARMQNTTDWVMEVASGSDDYSYSEGTTVTYTDNYAADYRIGLYADYKPEQFASQEGALEAILWERTLELGFEGERFYDLVRFDEDYDELTAYYEFMVDDHSYLSTADYAEDLHERLLPFPSTAIANAQTDGVYTLKQNPGF